MATPEVMRAVGMGRKVIADREAAAVRAAAEAAAADRQQLADVMGAVAGMLAEKAPGWHPSFAEHLGCPDGAHRLILGGSPALFWVDLPGCTRVSFRATRGKDGGFDIAQRHPMSNPDLFSASHPGGGVSGHETFAEAVAAAFERRQEAIRYAEQYTVPPGIG